MSDQEARRWYDIPGVAGLLGGVVFLAVMTGGYALASWLIHGEVTW